MIKNTLPLSFTPQHYGSRFLLNIKTVWVLVMEKYQNRQKIIENESFLVFQTLTGILKVRLIVSLYWSVCPHLYLSYSFQQSSRFVIIILLPLKVLH